MKAQIYIITLTIFTLANLSHAQNTGQQWKVYTTQNSELPSDGVGSLACENINGKNVIWINTTGGLAKFDGSNWYKYDSANSPLQNGTGNIAIDKNHIKWFTSNDGLYKFDEANNHWTLYDSSYTPLPTNKLHSITIDHQNVKWIGTARGLIRLDDSKGYPKWRVYDSNNSGLPFSLIWSLAIENIDSQTIVWIAAYGRGLVKFDYENNEWTTYNVNNSQISSDYVREVSVDKMGDVWLGFQFAFINRFNDDNNQWSFYSSSNSSYPSYTSTTDIISDKNNTKWMATYGSLGGMIKYSDNNWFIYTQDNSPIPTYSSHTIAIDSANNKWLGTANGLVVYNESGIVEVNNNITEIPNSFRLYQNYPNPFNPETAISYQLSANSDVDLSIYDITGKLISTLVNERQSIGIYNIRFNGSGLPSGIYFYTLTTDNFSQTRKMLLIK